MSKYDRLDLFCRIYKLFPRENPMTEHMNNSELISKLEAAEKRIVELERDLGAALDVTKHNQVEHARVEDEERYRLLFEYSPVATWEEDFSAAKTYLEDLRNSGVTDFDAHFTAHEDAIRKCVGLIKIIDVNQAAVRMYEASTKAELLGSFENTFPSQALIGFRNELVTVAKGELTYRSESLVETFHGNMREVAVHWTVAPGYEQTYAKVLVTLSDITDLRRAQERYEEIFENSAEGIFQSSPEGQFLKVNPAMARIYGYASPEEMIATVTDIARQIYLTSRDREQFTNLLAAQDSILNFEMKNYRKDRTIMWTSTSARAVRDENRQLLFYEGFLQDITERKQAEAAREEAELRYRALFEQSHDAIFIFNLEGRHLDVNQRATDMLGFSRDELLQFSAQELSVEPAKSQKVWQGLLNGERLPVYERSLRRKDGINILVEINVELIHNAQGMPLHIQSIAREITDRRRAEIELQHRNEDLGLINAINEVIVQGGNLETVVKVLAKQLRHIFSIQGTSIYMLGLDGRSLTMQQYAIPSELKRKIEKLIGSTIPIIQIPVREGGLFERVLNSRQGTITSDTQEIQSWIAEFAETSFLPPVARSAVRKLVPQIYKILNIKSTIVVPLISNEGAIGLLDVSSSSLFTMDDLKRIENIGVQLTAAIQRQQAHEKIQRSEEFLNSIQNALSASIAILDETGVIIRVNAAWRKFGEQNGLKEPDDCIGQNYLEICESASGSNAEEAPVIARAIREVLTSQRKEAWVEYPGHSPEEQRWFVVRITRFEDGDRVRVVLAHENITERKQAENSLQRSEAILAQAAKMAHLGAWEIAVSNSDDLKDNPLRWSDEVYRIFGYEPGEIELTNDIFFERVHPDDRQKVQKSMSQAIAAKEPYEVEHRIIRPNGIERIVEERADFMFDERGKLLQILGAVQDVTERKQTEQNLRETSEQFRTLFEASPEAIILVDPHGNWPILDCNATACSMNGYTREELIGQSIDLLTLRPGNSAGRLEYLESIRNVGILRYDDFHRHKDGSIFPIEISTSLITLGGREIVLGIDRDITERKSVEEALRESEALYQRAMEVAGAVPYYQSYDDNDNSMKYEFMGEGIRQITGYGPKEFNAQLWDSLIQEINLVGELEGYSLEEGIERVRSGKNPIWKCEYRIHDRAGKIHWVFEAAVELRDEHGISSGSIGTFQDITERKHAERALRESERRYRALFEDMPIAIWEEDFSEVKKHLDLLKEQGVTDFRAYFESHPEVVSECDSKIRILDVNNAALRMYGANNREELLQNMELGSSQAELDQVRSFLISIADGKLSHSWEGPDRTISGQPIEINLSVTVSPGYEKDYARVIVTTVDITQRKRAESELRVSEERFRQLADNIQEAFWMTDATTGEEIYASPAAEKIWGHPLESLLHDSDLFIETVLTEDRHAVQQVLEIQKGGKNTEMEYRITRPDGAVRWIWDRAFPIFDDAGRVVRLAGVAADITERKHAEEALHESELKYRNLVETSHDLIWTTDGEGRITYLNQASRQIYGYEPEELIGHSFFEMMVPQSHPRNLDEFKETIAGKDKFVDAETIVRHRDGRQIILSANSLVLRDENKNVIGIVGTSRDITERKKAEEALRQSEVRFAGVVNSAMDAVISVDMEQRIVLFNPAAEQMFGCSAKEVIGQPLERFIPSRYRVQHKEHISRFGQTGDTSRAMGHLGTLYGLRTDGNEFPIEASISHVEANGQHLYTVILRDITERKQVEEQLRKLSRAVEQSASIIVITDTKGQIEYVNPKFTEITGYTVEEALGQNPRILRSGVTPPEVYAELWRAITSGQEWHGELLNKKKNGELYWESVTISPILNEHGETTHFIAVKEGITERKQNETETIRHLAELEALYENGLAVGRLLEPQAIGQRIIQTFSQYLSWHHVTIRLRKDDSEELDLIAFQLPHATDGTIANEELHIKSRVSRVGQGISGWVAQTGTPLRTSNLPEDPHYVKTYEDMQSGLYMPLRVGDRIIGVISVESEEPDAFSEQDERLLATLANQAATAFENARLYQSAQKEIWDRRIAEEALRQSEENYRRLALELEVRVYERTAEVQDLYDNAPCGYHSLDQDGRIIRINQTELNWLGYAREEVIGQPLQDFITNESRINFLQSFPAFKQHGMIRDLELEMLRKDGSIFPALISATAIYDKDGRYLTNRSTLFDDTDRKHAMETLRLANSEMKRAMRMKDEFLANMSHELRTPLNAILGLSESLLEQTAGPINEKQHKYLGTVNESGRHLLELINDILDLAKIESGQIKIDPARVNINTTCETSLRMIKQLAQKKNQTVEVEIEDEIGHVWADERRLKQMMVNLLSNAVKFTPEGGQLGLKARIDRREMNLLITIWDRGIGIREQDLKRLFRPFVQLDSSLSRESAGTGLGLALVAEMARLHGGSVSVLSQPGEGSQFTIVLPWDPGITSDTIDKLKITGKIPIMRRSAADKPTLLLVEDTESVVLMLRDYLELSGYQVVIATDGLEGVSKAIALRPDLILMDVQMPNMDGLEATRQIRKEASLKDTPIIALTALAMPSDRELCLEAGMSDYFSKPVNLKELAKAIQRHLPDSGTGKTYEYDPHRR